MQKKWLIVGSIIFIVILIVGVIFWKKSTSPLVKTSDNSPIESPALTIDPNLTVWDDPLGFTFNYPKDISVDKHDEDQENYAHVELTHKDYPGNLIVWAKDLPVGKSGKTINSLSNWITSQKDLKSGESSDTTLDNQPAKKILIDQPKKMQLVAVIYDELLYTIETTPETGDYWTKVHDTVVSSFKFKTEKVQKSGLETGGGDESAEAVDEEEVVE